MKPILKTIVSVTKDWAIGAAGDLLIYNPKDMAFFKEQTTGDIVIMGWNTLLSRPQQKPLSNRRNIVLYDNVSFTQEEAAEKGFEVAHNLDEVFELLEKLDPKGLIETNVAWSIGGAMLYKTLLPYCAEALVTMNDVCLKDKADVFFPNLLENADWELAAETDGGITEEGFDYAFQTYKNKAPKTF